LNLLFHFSIKSTTFVKSITAGLKFVDAIHFTGRLNDGAYVSNTLHASIDFKSDQLRFFQHFYYSLGANGTYIWDLLHRISDDYALGKTKGGLNLNNLRWHVVFKAFEGPFQSDANAWALSGNAQQMKKDR